MFTLDDINKARSEWPFKNMEIGEVASYSFNDNETLAVSAQAYAHVFGRQTGKKFKTRKMKKDGVDYMVIARIS
jgi:hypothetical protein